MSRHQLTAGKQAIAFLGRLGSAIGCEVMFEYPISPGLGSRERCDVAWMTDKEQESPLFVFEVESTSTNSMTYNALKVFSKSSEEFLKPLFLFHIVISGKEDSSVAESLIQQFGKFNYRLFHLAQRGWVPIICAVLEQHRRVSLSVDLAGLIEALLSLQAQYSEIEQVIAVTEKLRFRKSVSRVPRVLAAYCRPSFLAPTRTVLSAGWRSLFKGHSTIMEPTGGTNGAIHCTSGSYPALARISHTFN